MKRRFLFLAFILIAVNCHGQTKFPELSPHGRIEQVIGFTTLSITYERPSVRGRKIFGDLVPFEKVWRTGAGPCTKISFNETILLDNRKILPGTYSVFTIPGIYEWTVILNQDTTLYGAFDYAAAKDVIRFKTKATKANRFFESLTFDADVVGHTAELYISWENTQVHFPIKTFTDEITMAGIKNNLLSGNSKDWNEYADAADYYLYNNKDLDEALILADKAIEHHGELFSYIVKMQVLARQKKYPEAISVGEEGLKFIKAKGTQAGYDRNAEITSMESRINKLKRNLK